MVPRAGLRVKILSPNSGIASYSRSGSVLSSSSGTTRHGREEMDRRSERTASKRTVFRQLDGNCIPQRTGGNKDPLLFEGNESASRSRQALVGHTHEGSSSWSRETRQRETPGGLWNARRPHQAAGNKATQRSSDPPLGFRDRIATSMHCQQEDRSEDECLTAPPPLIRRRALRLPSAIPITREDSSSGGDGSSPTYSLRQGRCFSRQHACPGDLDEEEYSDQHLPRRRREDPQRGLGEPLPSCLYRVPHDGGIRTCSAVSVATAKEASRSVIGKAMFKGLSAIPVPENLFGNGDDNNYRTAPSDATSPLLRHSQRHCCANPLWCLIGTFKTGLSCVVGIDYVNDFVKWTQRNPKGGYQTMRVPLSSLLDVAVASVVHEDEGLREPQFSVIVRTSTRPSQVVFGFATRAEANAMRVMLARK